MDRRKFVGSSLSAVVGGVLGAGRSVAAPAVFARRADADLVLRRATVFDGTGGERREADVAVRGDAIDAIGSGLEASGAVEIDLNGLALAPGFIDIHGHSDIRVLINPHAESKVRQGVTTEIVGQDGSSIGPWTAEKSEARRDSLETRYGLRLQFRTLADYFAAVESSPSSMNIASMIGSGTVREWAIGLKDRPATDEELQRMRKVVEEAVRAGACGLSSGLEYIPNAYSSASEIVEMAGALEGTGLCYATHMRNEDNRLVGATEEAVFIGQRARVPVQISHLKVQGSPNWWKADLVLGMIDAAAARGQDVTFDRYPYVAYSTGLGSLFPTWVREGGSAAFLERLDDPELLARAEAAVRGKVSDLGSWDSVQVTSTAEDSLAWARGRRLGELAVERGEEPFALLLSLIRNDRGRSSIVGFGMSEENTEKLLAHPRAMVCSDGSALATYGPLSSGTPHPRSYGTFPRVLGHYCRDRGAMSLEEAVAKMSGRPAAKLRLSDRGFVQAGMAADLVVFDPDQVADMATFSEPHQYPRGVQHVMVNGTFVVRDGEHTGELPGRLLRPTLSGFDRPMH